MFFISLFSEQMLFYCIFGSLFQHWKVIILANVKSLIIVFEWLEAAVLKEAWELGLNGLFYRRSYFKFIGLINWFIFLLYGTKRLSVKPQSDLLRYFDFLVEKFMLEASDFFEFGALFEHLMKGNIFGFLNMTLLFSVFYA